MPGGFCPDCFKGTIHDGTPRGKMETVHGISTYVARPEGDVATGAAIIFISDIFGMKLINNKLLADKYAEGTKCRVLMPDVVPDGGAPLSMIDSMHLMNTTVAWYDVITQARRAIAGLHAISIMGPMFYRTRNIIPTILEYSRAVKAELPAGGRLGVAGFCWGGYQSNLLAREPAVDGGNTGIVDAHFVAHPSGYNIPKELVGAFSKFKVPLSFAIGDRDMLIPASTVPSLEKAIADECVGNTDLYELVIYKGGTHGFAVRADPKEEIEDKAAIEATEQATRWFRKHLKLEQIDT